MQIRHLLPLAAVLSLALTGCATRPALYQWGGYDQDLYAGYKDTTQMETLRVKLEANIAALQKSGQKVAPGLNAEVGTLYLQSGAADKAVIFYKQERDAWPESVGLMTAMIQNIERRQTAAGAAK